MKRSKGIAFWSLTFLMLAALALPSRLSAQGNFVYTNDNGTVSGSNTVSGFSVASNGTLTPVPGSPFATGGTGPPVSQYIASNVVAVSTLGNFLFASNGGSNDVSVFSINASTGTLSLVAGSPFPTGGSAFLGIALSATPDDKFLIAANSGSVGSGGFTKFNLTVFSIASSGALTPIPGSPFSTLASPDGIKVSPDGKFLAVAENVGSGIAIGTNQVEMFNGSLTSLGAFPGSSGIGNGLAGVDINCASSLLYGGESTLLSSTLVGNTVVDGYSIASNGILTPLPGSPFEPGVGKNSNVVLLSPDDKTLFVSNQSSNTITVFTVASNGILSLVSGSPFPMNGSMPFPLTMATSQDGTLLYVADDFTANPSVSVFSVASGGALTEVAGSPFSTGRCSPGQLCRFGGVKLTAFPPKTCSPQQATQAIINAVNALFSQGVLNGGQENSLVVKLQHAINLMNAAKTAAAIGNLHAFIGEVNDLLSSGVLSPSQAAPLISAAESVIARLS